MSKIIGVSSYSGGGKSTLARYLTKEPQSTLLIWDDYDEAGLTTHPP
ncbi:MAG: hypothetical protein ACRCYY_16020 [Trueperaceae bacterium]